MVVVDANSQFRGALEAMCKLLKIKLWNLAHENHKLNSVEKYHRFLNKTQAIVGKDRGSHNVFIQNS